MKIYEAIQRAEKRRDGIRKWLKENHPETFEEQKHCDGGTPERAYWHHGYMMGIRDLIALFQSSDFTTKDDREVI